MVLRGVTVASEDYGIRNGRNPLGWCHVPSLAAHYATGSLVPVHWSPRSRRRLLCPRHCSTHSLGLHQVDRKAVVAVPKSIRRCRSGEYASDVRRSSMHVAHGIGFPSFRRSSHSFLFGTGTCLLRPRNPREKLVQMVKKQSNSSSGRSKATMPRSTLMHPRRNPKSSRRRRPSRTLPQTMPLMTWRPHRGQMRARRRRSRLRKSNVSRMNWSNWTETRVGAGEYIKYVMHTVDALGTRLSPRGGSTGAISSCRRRTVPSGAVRSSNLL